jgi:hypothetical protein
VGGSSVELNEEHGEPGSAHDDERNGSSGADVRRDAWLASAPDGRPDRGGDARRGIGGDVGVHRLDDDLDPRVPVPLIDRGTEVADSRRILTSVVDAL